MSRTVVILGAGASQPFFEPSLTTASLTALVLDWSKWEEILARYHRAARLANTIHPPAVRELLDRIQEVSDSPNFEDITDIIDKVASYHFDRAHHKSLHAAIACLKPRPQHYPTHSWTAVPFLIRQLICEHIQAAHDCGRRPDYDGTLGSFAEFIAHLHATGDDLSLVSFNYDDVLRDAVAVAGIRLEDGFRKAHFYAPAYLRADTTLTFLHGSARFVLDATGMRQCATIAQANEQRLANLYSSAASTATEYLRDASSAYDFNTFITSGRDKERSMDVNPYAAYYQRLASDLLNAERVVVIGWSLQDLHIVRLLRNWLQLRATNALLIVDYEPRPIDIMRDFIDQSSIVARALDAVGVRSLPMHGVPSKLKYDHQDALDELNGTGSGTLYPQVSLCKLGLLAFLENHNAILGKTLSR